VPSGLKCKKNKETLEKINVLYLKSLKRLKSLKSLKRLEGPEGPLWLVRHGLELIGQSMGVNGCLGQGAD